MVGSVEESVGEKDRGEGENGCNVMSSYKVQTVDPAYAAVALYLRPQGLLCLPQSRENSGMHEFQPNRSHSFPPQDRLPSRSVHKRTWMIRAPTL